MIVAFAGLPGTGKSTLARALAGHLAGSPVMLLDKDTERYHLFGDTLTTYDREQDDFVVDLLYRAAAWQLRRDPATTVILDGRTYSRAYQVTQLHALAAELAQPLVIVECVCAPATALTRLHRDHTAASHPAADRTPDLHHRLRADADPISTPTLVLDTDAPAEHTLSRLLTHLTSALNTQETS
ncbi:putative kinase [Lentzea atacamensis]|uniref:Kinase n=1 Tax=Lentzea atacamensis TaxID=531938 RepID=A0ABX9DY57_9PSEU|nr:AAA family ATPase [Lentzea atacamensis]RAS59425.1 putative kinase [Lentzea atacamensis]